MNPELHPPASASPPDEILILGFEGAYSDSLLNYNGTNDHYHLWEFENSFLAFRYLEEISQESNSQTCLPRAVICEFNFLKEENFLFLGNLKGHPTLKYMPLITMNRDGLNHKLEALQLGFDDYYDVPVNWQVLKNRIDFLNGFKREIDTCELPVQEVFPTYNSKAKRVCDVIIAAIALILLSPLMLIIALFIKIESRGPVIYRSLRVGTGYHVFEFMKFRSMYKDADKRMSDLEHLNQYSERESHKGLFRKFNNDPRVSKIGLILRKTSLDELPQLFNIIKGDMSIVGNRPLPLYEAQLLTRDVWARRFLAPAGLTGLWQVSKRGKANMSSEERINLDVAYAKNHSFWTDIKIILKTLPAMIQEENV